MTPTTYGRDFAYCLKSHGGVRGFNASLWQFLLRCTLFCHSVATFLTSVSSYEGGCGFEANVKTAVRSYVKASGGYKQAARQARVARQLTGKIFYLLTGSPADIKSRFEEIGIQVENRPVKDVLSDICQYLAPKPDSLEDALVTDALMEALSKLYETIDVKEASFDVVNKELLQKMLMLFVKEYIYLKIIRDCSYGALKKCESVREIKEGEKKVKNYVDSIVDAVLPSYFEEDVTQDEIVTAVTGMYEACYKEAERI